MFLQNKTSGLLAILLIPLISHVTFALEPNEILVIANKDVPASVRVARYYCAKRKVPPKNILVLPLGETLEDSIGRDQYNEKLALPVRTKLLGLGLDGTIRCLLTTYGVPFKASGRGILKGSEAELEKLQKSRDELKKAISGLPQDTSNGERRRKDLNHQLALVESEIDRITGKETGASVDSELSMVLSGDYELYRWQTNRLQNAVLEFSLDTLMVSRLDGPSEQIAKGLVDKAIRAEANGLDGIAYVDSRGIEFNRNIYSLGYFDQSLRDLAALIRVRTSMTVKEEPTDRLFEVGSCPQTALYCGWYSLGKYVDAFDFVDGAIAYHIASFEAVDLRDANSTQWCPAMLRHGVTATLGPVAEPYLHAFPLPKEFFLELFDGRCLVEAYYRTSPFNSWQMVLIGDPLYKPFKARR
jgi:uncharacterized protein (TIGR03790 family)